MHYCPDCGEPLEDFSPCGCIFAQPTYTKPKSKTKEGKSRRIAAGGMRQMVARKLQRQAANKREVG